MSDPTHSLDTGCDGQKLDATFFLQKKYNLYTSCFHNTLALTHTGVNAYSQRTAGSSLSSHYFPAAASYQSEYEVVKSAHLEEAVGITHLLYCQLDELKV